MKITKIDKAAMIALREPLNAVLKELGEKLGLDITVGNGSYTPDGAEAHFKLELKVDDPAVKLAAAKAQWDRNCQYVGIDFDKPDETGLRADDFGTEFDYGQKRLRTCGIEVRRSKFPIRCEVVSGPEKGKFTLLPETAVARIRLATDSAAKAKAA